MADAKFHDTSATPKIPSNALVRRSDCDVANASRTQVVRQVPCSVQTHVCPSGDGCASDSHRIRERAGAHSRSC